MIKKLIESYRRIRTEHALNHTYRHQYAFVGMGQHSLTNLYPVLFSLQVPLKYICVTTARKARLIGTKYAGIEPTTSLQRILDDETVKGIFVCAAPSSHYRLSSDILASGKSLFVEKPPCSSLKELDSLIGQCRTSHAPVAMAGLQKRYAPATAILKKRLCREHVFNYDLHYVTGACPEGNVVTDLYIHPIDLVTYLFGKADIIACEKVTSGTYLLMLRHGHIVGTLELSTEHSWTDAEESLKISTSAGVYNLRQMEELSFVAKQMSVCHLPLEKILPRNKTMEYLYSRNNFVPVLANNQICSQGYYHEVKAFVDKVEGRRSAIHTGLEDLRDTYRIMDYISGL